MSIPGARSKQPGEMCTGVAPQMPCAADRSASIQVAILILQTESG